jgi:peptidyl-tRNA hydrolase
MATQTSHASVSAIVENYEDKLTQEYISKENIDNMHKVVLSVESEEEILETEKMLKEDKISYRIWREQPENIITALALKPYYKSTVSKYFKKFKLFR